MLRYVVILCSLLVFSNTQPAFATAVDGNWDLSFNPPPKVVIVAFGQRMKPVLPELPTADRITFTPDADLPNTGSFTSTLFSGEWKQPPKKLKGTGTESFVEPLVDEYLQKGSFYGFSFSGGELKRTKTTLLGKVRKDGTLVGSFTHISHWTIHLTEPREIDVPIQVKLTAKFKGTRSPAE